MVTEKGVHESKNTNPGKNGKWFFLRFFDGYVGKKGHVHGSGKRPYLARGLSFLIIFDDYITKSYSRPEVCKHDPPLALDIEDSFSLNFNGHIVLFYICLLALREI